MVCQCEIHGAANGYMSVSRSRVAVMVAVGRGHWKIGV